MTNTNTIEFSLYVGTYAKYNNGDLSGQWVNLADYPTKAEFLAYCAEIHKDETDPEFMFQASENTPANLYCESDCSGLYEVIEFAAKNNIDNMPALLAFISNVGREYGLQSFDEAYCGEQSQSDFAYELVDSCFDIPENIKIYFDYDKWERDLFMSDYTYIDGFIFHNI
jgi:antirestriction protein